MGFRRVYCPPMASPLHTDADFMRMAIRLAMRGRGRVEPNPMVGCVLAKEGRVISQGWHERYGGPHAEPNALAACIESPAGATAYVTLEPCCHLNKQTPPCVPRLIEAKLARVVLGSADPNPEVAGKGVAQLRAAGIQVDGGCLEAEAKQLTAPFFASVVHRRPYITLKWAETADGKIAGPGGRRLQISNQISSRAVHQLRANCDAILVGVNTVLADDPMLTARGVEHARPLLRIVLDDDLRTPIASKLAKTAANVPVLIACRAGQATSQRADEFRSLGVQIKELSSRAENLQNLQAELGSQRMTHLLVEPGPTLAKSFIQHNLVDRVWIIRSPKPVDDATAPAAALLPANYRATGEIDLSGDTLTEYLNPASAVFFAPEPSADFVQATQKS